MTTGRINQVTILTAGGRATHRDPPSPGGRAVHQRSRGRRRPPAPRSPEQKLHRSPRAIQFLPQSSPGDGPPYRRSGCHRPPSRSRTYAPQEEDTHSRSHLVRDGYLPGLSPECVRITMAISQQSTGSTDACRATEGRQDLSRLCDPNSSARQSTTRPRANDHGQPLADPRSAHGQGRGSYGTVHIADATGYRCRGICVCAIYLVAVWSHIQLHVGCCRHSHDHHRSLREPPVAMTPTGHQGPPTALASLPPRPPGAYRRSMPAGGETKEIYSTSAGRADFRTSPRPPLPEPLVRPG